MKYLTKFKMFENLESKEVDIDKFLDEIGFVSEIVDRVSEWWGRNRGEIGIHFFGFNTRQPIGGCFLGVDKICINSDLYMPPHIKLFIALHESRHCDQHREGRFEDGYWHPVVEGRKEDFLAGYRDLERDANDFAINSMRELGFSGEMDREGMRLRSNEMAGEMVYRMMSNDIERLGATDMFDLLKKQIGI